MAVIDNAVSTVSEGRDGADEATEGELGSPLTRPCF